MEDKLFTDECKHLQSVGVVVFFAATNDGVDAPTQSTTKIVSEYN